jgi:hypothetical protein
LSGQFWKDCKQLFLALERHVRRNRVDENPFLSYAGPLPRLHLFRNQIGSRNSRSGFIWNVADCRNCLSRNASQ